MEVGDEDGLDVEPRAKTHHLALGTLPAVEQHEIALALNGNSTDVAAHRRAGCGSAKEGDSDHWSPQPTRQKAANEALGRR